MESGKTSFTAVLANRAIANNIVPAIIDADIGQADIGPPAFVSMSMPSSWVIWLRQLEPLAMRFVGSIEPSAAAGRVISAVTEMVEKARSMGAGLIVIDTDGWVRGWSALEFKVDLLRSVGADFVAVMGDAELFSFISRAVGAKVYHLRSPQVQAIRDVDDRRKLRALNYKRFIEGDVVEVDLTKVPVQGGCLASSIPLDDKELKKIVSSTIGKEVVSAAKYPGGLCILVDSDKPVEQQAVKAIQKALQKKFHDVEEVIVTYTGGLKGVLAALTDSNGVDHPAKLLEFDASTMTAKFETRYKGPITRVIFSKIRLDEDFTEAGKRRIWI